MNRATGVHFHGDALRLVTLQADGGEVEVCTALERGLPHPFGPDALHTEAVGRGLAEVLADCLAQAGDTGDLRTLLPGGWYQIQKVPLEVASVEDRRIQMLWEAAQGFAAQAPELEIHYLPARRSAFWLASRRSLLQKMDALFVLAGVQAARPVAEAVALLNACSLAGALDRGTVAAVSFALPWLCMVSAHDGDLVSAQSVRADVGPSRSATTDPPQPTDAGAHGPADTGTHGPAAAGIVRRWLAGEPVVGRKREPFARLLVCGDHDGTDPLLRPDPLRREAAKLLMPFAACTGPASGGPAAIPENQTDFAIAAGLAYSGILKDTPV